MAWRMVVAMSVASGSVLLGQAPRPQDLAPGSSQALDQVMVRLADSGFSGSVLVARHDAVLLHRGYGWLNRATSSRILPDSKFYVASISKQFAAAALLKLEEQGRLTVTDRIGKYFAAVPADKAGITLHALLTHTSGLGQQYAADGIVDRTEAVRKVLAEPLLGKPGEFHYTNDGYTLLAAVIEIAAGAPFETYLRRELLQPAGLSSTGFWGDSVPAGEPQIAPTLRVIQPQPNWGFRAATGMFSTTADLDRWRRALQAGAVLTGESVRKMFTPYVTTSAGGYGYGWFVSKTRQGIDSIWTAGSEDFGHNAVLSTYADGTVIVVASNAGDLGGTPARDVAKRALEDALFRAVAAGEATRQTASVARPLDAVEGLVPHHVRLDAVDYRGRRAVHVVNAPASSGQAVAFVSGTALQDGTIEADVAGQPEAGASPSARGFIGLAFRAADESHFECFYIRPTNGRADDQLRRNHATQYVSLPTFEFDRLRAEAPGVYESYVDLVSGAWTHLRIDVAGQSAKLYVNGATEPTLLVTDLKRPTISGLVGLWIGDETDGYFSRLTILDRASASRD